MFILILLLKLPSTLMHELCHLTVALLTFSRIKSFSIIPKIEGRNLVLGNVKVIPSFKGALIFIGLAPTILWILAFIMIKNHIIIYNEFLTYIIVFYMLIGGKPSRTDLNSAISGVFSISGIALLSMLTISIAYFFKDFILF